MFYSEAALAAHRKRYPKGCGGIFWATETFGEIDEADALFLVEMGIIRKSARKSRTALTSG